MHTVTTLKAFTIELIRLHYPHERQGTRSSKGRWGGLPG